METLLLTYVVRVRKKSRVGVGTAEGGITKHLKHCERNFATMKRELMAGIETYEHFKPFFDWERALEN
jgi:hypothetical protein